MNLFASERSRTQLAWIAVAAVWAVLGAMAWRGGLIADEWIHFPQVARLRAGEWAAIDPNLTTPPGFHALVAAAMALLGAESLGAARWLCALAAVAAVACFHGARRAATGDASLLPAQQFALWPLLACYGFLVYTDVLSLAMVLGAWWLALRHRHLPAALVLLASLTVRQTNILWAAFVAAFALWDAVRWQPWRDWRATLRIAWPYLLVASAFVALWAAQGRISMSAGQQAAHPDLSFHVGNLYFALALVAATMPLHVALGLRRFAALPKAWWLLPLASLALFFALFAVDHPYNRAVPQYNFRNAFLLYLAAHPWANAAFGLVATLGACAIAGTPARRAGALLPFALLALCTAWMIEPRYTMVPIALWLALRRQESAAIEWTTLALWGALAVYFATGLFDYRFMI